MTTNVIIAAIIGAFLAIIGLILVFTKHESFLVCFIIGIVVLISAIVVGTVPQCPDCGKRYDSSYCINCGTEMLTNTEKFCTICNKEIKNKKAEFCPDCGTILSQKEIKRKTEVVFSNE